MFVDRNGHPTGRPWEYCAVCRFHHYDVDTYIAWLLKYRNKSSGRKHVDRWRAIVERHGVS